MNTTIDTATASPHSKALLRATQHIGQGALLSARVHATAPGDSEAAAVKDQPFGRARVLEEAGPAGSPHVDETRSSDVDEVVTRALAAQRQFAAWNERQVDELLATVAEHVARAADDLARRTAQETGMGNARDKAVKILFASRTVQRDLHGRRAAGVLRPEAHSHVLEIASPVGVVLGLIPVTNPVATLVFKTLIALKGRNALIASCHHRAREVCRYTTERITAALRIQGAPADLVQFTPGGDRTRTVRFMRHPGVSLIVATGGSSMVKEAYSSGTPTIGVGPGNAPAWVCHDADADSAAMMIVDSKSFDNGIICGSENHLVVDERVYEKFVAALASAGAAVLNPPDAAALSKVIFDPTTGSLRHDLIGRCADELLARTGLSRCSPARLIVAPRPVSAADGPWGREKLAPVLPLFKTTDSRTAIALCRKLLERQGRGHTAVIHSQDEELIRQFGLQLEAARILVNTPASQGCIGMSTGLPPSLTLGSGTSGGTSTTDNVTYTHLLNIRHIAFPALKQTTTHGNLAGAAGSPTEERWTSASARANKATPASVADTVTGINGNRDA